MNTEQLICDTLIDMIEEKPFEQIKVTQLTERCGISRSSFYVYFSSIYDVVQHIEDQFLENAGPETLHSLHLDQKLLEKTILYLRDHIREMTVLCGPNGDPSFRARLLNRNRRILQIVAKEKGVSLREEELQVINAFSQQGKLAAIQWWADNENNISTRDMAKMFEKFTTAIYSLL